MKTNSLVKFIFTKEYFCLIVLVFIWMCARGLYFQYEPKYWSMSALLIVLVFAPIFEEFAFRGYMLHRLNLHKNFYHLNWNGIGVANWLVSLIFTLTHYDVWTSFIWFFTELGQIVMLDYIKLATRILGVMTCSLFYGQIYEKYKLLRFSIFMHFSVNFIGLFHYTG